MKISDELDLLYTLNECHFYVHRLEWLSGVVEGALCYWNQTASSCSDTSTFRVSTSHYVWIGKGAFRCIRVHPYLVVPDGDSKIVFKNKLRFPDDYLWEGVAQKAILCLTECEIVLHEEARS